MNKGLSGELEKQIVHIINEVMPTLSMLAVLWAASSGSKQR